VNSSIPYPSNILFCYYENLKNCFGSVKEDTISSAFKQFRCLLLKYEFSISHQNIITPYECISIFQSASISALLKKNILSSFYIPNSKLEESVNSLSSSKSSVSSECIFDYSPSSHTVENLFISPFLNIFKLIQYIKQRTCFFSLASKSSSPYEQKPHLGSSLSLIYSYLPQVENLVYSYLPVNPSSISDSYCSNAPQFKMDFEYIFSSSRNKIKSQGVVSIPYYNYASKISKEMDHQLHNIFPQNNPLMESSLQLPQSSQNKNGDEDNNNNSIGKDSKKLAKEREDDIVAFILNENLVLDEENWKKINYPKFKSSGELYTFAGIDDILDVDDLVNSSLDLYMK
jgi:hypothetical protein